jgi:hypothetical protein
MLLLTGLVSVSAANFATKRLQSIAQCLSLPGVERLNNETSFDYQYRGRKLVVRANRYGEIEHIGLALFPKEMAELSPSPVYDFLERDLLERQLTNLDGELQHKLKGEHLAFVVGNAQTAMRFDGTENFSEERIDLKSYRVTWTRNDSEVLKISFDMDIEMLLGCNAIEMEQLFIRRLKRHQPQMNPRDVDIFPAKGNTYVEKGDTFLIGEMRNDLYFERDNTGWHLTDKADNTSKHLSNMMLSTQYRGNPMLQLTIDKYGYESEQVNVPYKQLLSMAIEDGCTPYFGIKERKDDGSYTGTVMLVNNKGGYVHMLTAAVPSTTLSNKGEGLITGRLYVYIPMHNVSDRYFQRNSDAGNNTKGNRKGRHIKVSK